MMIISYNQLTNEHQSIFSGRLSSGASLPQSCPALAGENHYPSQPKHHHDQDGLSRFKIPNHYRGRPKYHHDQGVRDSWTGNSAYCSQWQRIFLWSASEGEFPQQIIYGHMAKWQSGNMWIWPFDNLAMIRRLSQWQYSGRHTRPCRTWRAPASRAMGQRTAESSRCCHFKVRCSLSCLVLLFMNCKTLTKMPFLGQKFCILWNVLDIFCRSGDAVYVAEIGPNRLRKFEVIDFDFESVKVIDENIREETKPWSHFFSFFRL